MLRLLSSLLLCLVTTDAYFGNARFVRNFVEKTLEEQANRLATISGNITTDMLQRIKKSDVENAIKAMKNNK